ncbi:4Fe-4S binding protein [Desulfopila sp. IMCC35008]|uniref:4Fe-4S binding protein n=1 Tax=Desulfopila sp. IMCC35008 TaxID=2653858 RepID=UPI0013D3F31B
MSLTEHIVDNKSKQPTGGVLVIGGGISGMQSALDLAESGFKVYLVESSPAIGGKMAQLDKTFPTNDCSMCIVSPKLVEVGRHKNIELLTHSELVGFSGTEGNFTARISCRARYVDIAKCTGCGLCELNCPVTFQSFFPEIENEEKKGKFPKAKIKSVITGNSPPTPLNTCGWTFTVDQEACGKCGLCYKACLQNAITWEKKAVAVIDQEKCTSCSACFSACPAKFSAITITNAPDLDKSMGAALVARSEAIRKDRGDTRHDSCIRCGLCTLMCKEVMGINALKIHENGIEAGVDICQVCGSCISVCPVDYLSIDAVSNRQATPLLDEFNEGLGGRKPVNIHYPQAVPRVPTIDAKSCIHLNTGNCGLCASICGVGAIDYEDRVIEKTIAVGSVIYSPGFEVSDPKLRREFGYGDYANVVTSIEFERLLSASGPTSGTVQRPGDGGHPKKIAWIQCVGSRDHSCSREYCSSVCCMYATKEAYIAREHDKEIEPTIFYIDMRSFGKNFDDYVTRAKENNVRYIRGMISRVFEDPQTGNLELRYLDEEGNRQQELFDMVVLSVGIQISESSKKMAGLLQIQTDSYGFAVTDTFKPLAASRSGIFVSGAFNGPKDIPETVSEASGAAEAASASLATVRNSLITQEVLPEELVPPAEDGLRIGVFICHCGTNIASVVDVEAVMQYASTLPNVVYVDKPLYTCSQDAQERMREIIKENRLNRIIVSACSPTTHEPLFMSTLRQAGLNKYFFDMANIRDQCSWVHPNDPDKATEKAKRLTKMAIANASKAEPLHEMEFDVDTRLLVIGGGIAGMTAALEAAFQGCNVFLIEREPILGGNLNTLRRTTAGEPVQNYIGQLIREVEQHERIKVYTSSAVVEHSGFVGCFETEIITPAGAPRTLKHGAVILTTGAEENRPDLYNLGTAENVMTQSEFERMMADDPELVSRFRSITMIQCVGSRDPDYQDYCSRVCCNQAVKNSLTLKALNPECRIDILYRDMRCYGLSELDYRRARQSGVNFIRYDLENNMPQCSFEDECIDISLYDPSIRMDINLSTDLLVLSTGLKPRETDELSSMLRCTRNRHGFFIEAHAKLRPVDLPGEGLFMAGTAHGPKNIPETISQAQASVARAMTILTQAKLTMSAVVSRVEPQNCAVCLTCVRACPYGVPFINEEHTAEINPALCQGCGICVAECPAKTIYLGRYNDANLFAKIHPEDTQQADMKEEVQ